MRIVIIAADYRVSNLRLQPWRFLSEIAGGLRELGYQVTVISDVDASSAPAGTVSVRSVRLPRTGNVELHGRVQALGPDVCIWNFGLTSAWHFAPGRVLWPSIAVFSSPIYQLHHLARLGVSRVWLARDQAPIHFAGAAVPRSRLLAAVGGFRSIVVQSASTFDSLASMGIARARLHLVRPGVDAVFRKTVPTGEHNESSFSIGFMGSPSPIRGVLDLVNAVAILRSQGLDVRLRVLSRNRGEHDHHEVRLKHQVLRLGLHDAVTVRSGFMSRQELIDELDRVQLVALPFQLVPADAPLAVLESMALGHPILATRVACVSEYLSEGRGYLADPGDPESLASAIRTAMVDATERRRVRHRALAYAKRFPSWSDVAARVSEIITDSSELSM